LLVGCIVGVGHYILNVAVDVVLLDLDGSTNFSETEIATEFSIISNAFAAKQTSRTR